MDYLQVSKHIKGKYLTPLENYKIENLKDVRKFHEELVNVRTEIRFRNGLDVTPHYRGEQNYGWDVLPGIYRPPFSTGIDLAQTRKIEKIGAEIFESRVSAKFGEKQLFKHSVKPYGEKWDLLFQAQHAGVKTNLIDFSTSSVLSAFFMCEPSKKYEKVDGQLWALLVPSEFIYNETSDYNKSVYPEINPYKLNNSFVCNIPTYLDDIDERTYQFRLFRQHGRLFASRDSDLGIPLNKKEFWENMMFRVRVPSAVKNTIFEELVEEGKDRESMMILESEEADDIIKEINNEMKQVALI
ncbi:FRG domain-containing protein [Gramella sp. KN1008]|uniref:FRG domain-containing protein n=1 Tax=Gramella sp. KN1008 TaxID=2529298 RepID=UPI00103CE21F|nr:FRG domain-containing protein [Gramella sp. KN1008]TBW28271.1 FRG domain-containing protein [Gramella sp. KN1008]